MPIEPVSIAASSERMSPNMLPVTITSNFFGALHQLHRRVVDVHVVELDVGILGVHLGDDVAPELEGLEHVGLVDAGQLLAALARGLERDVRDALDLRARVAHRVEGLVGALERAVGRAAAAARLAEVDVAGQLADDQDVEPGDELGLQARGVRSAARSRSPGGSWRTGRAPCAARGSPARGAARARACRTSSRRPRRTAPRRPPCASFKRRVGQRMAVRLVGGAADRRLLESRSGRSSAPSTRTRLGDDLGADAVTGQDCDLHESIPSMHRGCSRDRRWCAEPGLASASALGFEAADLVGVAQRQADVVEAVRAGSTCGTAARRTASSLPSGLTTTWRSRSIVRL